MTTDALPPPSESPRDVLKRKLDAWRQRVAVWWHSHPAPPAPPPGSTPAAASGGSQPARRRSGRGQKRMLWITGGAFIVLAVANQALIDVDHGPLWRVLLAIAAFLYVWWLASLLFDLVFVWHRYIQADAAHTFLRREVAPSNFRPENDPPTDTEGPGNTSLIPPSTPAPGGEGPPQPLPWSPKPADAWMWTIRTPTVSDR